jgi:acetyltransferase-like isoleucine patch superfamily enzyme/SAM-dependent methyltransferase
MKFANIKLGKDVEIDPSSSINNVIIGDSVKIAKRCSIYGGPGNLLDLGKDSYVGMGSILNGFTAKLSIGKNVSISQNVNIMVESGPNASMSMQEIFPIKKGSVTIGDHCWIGANTIIMPQVKLGEFCIVAANSFVNKSFPAFSIIGGSPARLIREFTETEKQKVLSSGYSKTDDDNDYEDKYIDLPFENTLREFRRKNILDKLTLYPHDRFLEIGCGADPLFYYFDDYDKMIVVEPGTKFFRLAQEKAALNSKIEVFNEPIESVADRLIGKNLNFIVIGGFLHEISNPDKVLKAVRRICSKDTLVYSYVPNARSFHRLLAYNMGIIKSIHEKSKHDILFKRNTVFNMKSFNSVLEENGFSVIDSGSYFIKPFTNDQMAEMIDKGILDNTVFHGLEKMIQYIPDMGAELWNLCKIYDKIS